MRLSLVLRASAALVLAGGVAAAADDDWDGGYGGPKPQHRSGFMLGASAGLALGSAAGYPLAAEKIGDERYRASTGFGVGPAGAVWLGGALADWLAVGLGVGFPQLRGQEQAASATAFLLRAEVFPALTWGSGWAPLGVHGSFGLAVATLERGGATTADGGSMSHVGLGLFHETLRVAGFALGPALDTTAVFSPTLALYAATLGLRAAYTTGP